MASRSALRVFVANLPWTVGKKELREHFSQFGYVASSSVVFDKKTGMSKGFGFVAFGNRDGFIGATKQQQHVLEGSTLSVRPATSP
ncbi:SRA stem-loop-interacting RNA-binding protein, mitochondrial isoform X1 [Dermacentor silvarum]|uniref:SRA stem-loop-interacting RNA-binding protein, mitochondrial isoform X1 n=1 Tax=Dermacentor silvarum TaxID=543639 RepID=UPI00189AD478|nr:SRA stem-loop-interacting RNA-binding protein, mitochondrial isoform X1 [Dermacentor silvarum]